MSAITNPLPTPPDNFSTQIASATVSSSAITFNVDDASGLPTEGVGVLFKKDSSGDIVAGSIEFIHWTGVSGNTVNLSDTGDRGLSGSDSGAQSYVADDYFEVWVSSFYYGSMKDSLPTGDVVGTTDTQTLTNKTHSGDFKLSGATDNIQVNGADPYRTITLPASSWFPTTTSGCASATQVEAATNDIDYYALDFDASSDENAFCNFAMPDSWDAGAIQFRYFWTNAGGGAAETVVFELSGRSFANDDAIDQAVGTPIEVSDTWIAQGDVHISSWSSDVTLAGTPAAGEFVHLELMRDVSEDNLTGDARILAVQIRYKQAQYGD